MIYYFGLRVMPVSLATGTAVIFEIKMFSFSLNALLFEMIDFICCDRIASDCVLTLIITLIHSICNY